MFDRQPPLCIKRNLEGVHFVGIRCAYVCANTCVGVGVGVAVGVGVGLGVGVGVGVGVSVGVGGVGVGGVFVGVGVGVGGWVGESSPFTHQCVWRLGIRCTYVVCVESRHVVAPPRPFSKQKGLSCK